MNKKIFAISIAIGAVFYFAVAELLVGRPFFDHHRRHVTFALGFLGLCGWLAGWYQTSKRTESEAADEEKRSLLVDPRYWSSMIFLLGAITLFFRTPVDQAAPVRPLRRVPEDKQPVVQPVAALAVPREAPAPVTFPSFKIQGIIIRDARSAVIVKGRTYLVGDQIDGATVKEITRETVTLEKSNQSKIISLGEISPAGVHITSAEK